MEIEAHGKSFKGATKINVLLGKNGSGKSTFLRTFDQYKQLLPKVGITRYITPERGGELQYAGGVDTNLSSDINWGSDVRRHNRFDNFRQLSVSEFRRLETLVLRKIEKDPATRQNGSFTFETTLASINELLDNVKITRSEAVGFDIISKDNLEKRGPSTLSSGESELISLGIEILSFAYSSDSHGDKTNYLFLDEPDVHLHPDLQGRLVKLIIDAIKGRDIVVFIATHSTAILGALSNSPDASVGFVSPKQNTINFSKIDSSLRNILPIFGAHPLSNVFNERPIFLVEGEDDERVWQQAVRSSQGKINIWPCQAGDIQSLNEYENQVEKIAGSIYENANAYSLRDRDEAPYEIDDKAIVKRMRLCCRASENLMLSDDVLNFLGTDWEKMKAAIDDWLTKFPDHQQHADMLTFKMSNFDRKTSDVKTLCTIFMMLAAARKPWEIAVGQAIARLLETSPLAGNDSLTAYLGPKLVDALQLKFRGKPRLSFIRMPARRQ